MAAQTGYTRLQIALHWVIALLIVFNYVFSEAVEEVFDKRLEGATDAATPLHVWVGLAVLALVLLRVAVRFASGAPAAPGVPGSMQVKAAEWGHRLLYLLMIGVPMGGAIAWFQGVEALAGLHGLFANVLVIVAGLHAVMALYHQYVLKDHLLRRMMKAR